ncbi:RNA editing complex protein MP67 [Leptomonas seymouri]|uniref:RNA editing complex protein MP67 n=1 Tax=Leptomonas seymouri TaxID=5684 RepID=A0A0N0P7V7_LEPSE|nr:RNA editing complex protein MP67 [Leptomonas seymouri]|eukprot:KPI89216.1 RNA editing complex protein MP67 [Leptomonas seymouri]
MGSTTLRRVWRGFSRDLAGWSTAGTPRPQQRTIGTSAPSPPSDSLPSSHLFENPSVRELNHSFLPDGVLSYQAAAWAKTTVEAVDRSGDKRSAFFDYSTVTCKLCGTTLTGSYTLHQNSVDHVARLDIVKRVLGFLYTFYNQVQSPDLAALSSSRQSRSASAKGSLASRRNAAQSCYYKRYSKSFLFEEEGVPSHTLLHHRPQLLRQLDLVDILLKRWWRTLHHAPVEKGDYTFDRILSLSSSDIQTRLHRLRYLIFFLTTRGVLRDSVAVAARADNGQPSMSGAGVNRTAAFERFEMIGDLEFKLFAHDRMRLLFPADEGGVVNAMHEIGRILDSNHGLLAIYDYLDMDNLLSVSLANNKTKADVMEALVGELRVLLWSSEVAYNTDAYPVPGERATTLYLRRIVEHTLHELGHVVLMWRIDSTLRSTKETIMSCLAKDFLEEGKRRHGHDAASTTELELSAMAPQNALQPLLLPWERRHFSGNSSKEEVVFAMARRPARPPYVFQAGLQHLSPSPCEQPALQRRQLSVGQSWSTAAITERMKSVVAESLVLHSSASATSPAEESRSRDTAVPPCSQVSCAVTATALPDLQPAPYPHRLSLPSSAEKRELVRVNCIVLQRHVPLSGML